MRSFAKWFFSFASNPFRTKWNFTNQLCDTPVHVTLLWSNTFLTFKLENSFRSFYFSLGRLSWRQFISLSIYLSCERNQIHIYLSIRRLQNQLIPLQYTTLQSATRILSFLFRFLTLVTENVNLKLTLHSLKTVFVTKRENKNEFKVKIRYNVVFFSS